MNGINAFYPCSYHGSQLPRQRLFWPHFRVRPRVPAIITFSVARTGSTRRWADGWWWHHHSSGFFRHLLRVLSDYVLPRPGRTLKSRIGCVGPPFQGSGLSVYPRPRACKGGLAFCPAEGNAHSWVAGPGTKLLCAANAQSGRFAESDKYLCAAGLHTWERPSFWRNCSIGQSTL
jgi:hypothetical protein